MKNFIIFIYNNKTKITGFLLVVIGAMQTNATIVESLMTPRQFAWFTLGSGCLVAGLGFINSAKPTIEKEN